MRALAAQEADDQAVAPYIRKARDSYPAARERFLAGLPPGETFLVVTRIVDADKRSEQVFIRVTHIEGEQISGSISSHIAVVKGYLPWQSYTFSDTELIDWIITKPDGSEEGNFVGRFLEGQAH